MKIAGLLLLFTMSLLPQPQGKTFPSVFVNIPAKARAKTHRLLSEPNSVAAGQKLLADHCGLCHGVAGEGTSRAPNLIANDDIEHATPGEIFWVITNGAIRKGMPPWSKMPEQQRWQIVAYLISVNPKGR